MTIYHVSEEDLHEFAGGELPPERRDEVAAHLEACACCRAAAEPLLALTARLSALPRLAEPETDPWPALHARLASGQASYRAPAATVISLDQRRARRKLPAWAARAAAAAAVFAVGFGGGRLTGTSGTGGVVLAPDTVVTALQAAGVVQRAGAEYVAAVARFVALSRGGDTVAAAQGREAALAACRGAARELTLLRPDDSLAVRLLGTAVTQRPASER